MVTELLGQHRTDNSTNSGDTESTCNLNRNSYRNCDIIKISILSRYSGITVNFLNILLKILGSKQGIRFIYSCIRRRFHKFLPLQHCGLCRFLIIHENCHNLIEK